MAWISISVGHAEVKQNPSPYTEIAQAAVTQKPTPPRSEKRLSKRSSQPSVAKDVTEEQPKTEEIVEPYSPTEVAQKQQPALEDLQPAAGPTVEKIIIKGNQRIEPSNIRSFLGINEGDVLDADDLDKALASIFASGLFADVSIDVENNNLIVNVIENPIIAEVAFEGNKRIDDEALQDEVKLGPRSVYTKSALQQDIKRVLDIYQKSGRFSAIVVPKVIQLPQNRVNLVFEIDEGKRAKISRISFVGNDAFSASSLRSVIETKETVWYRFFSSTDTYDPDRLAFDEELLRRHYASNGYADFKVLSANAELSQEKDAFFITFTLDEGQKYTFGKMSVESKLPKLEGSNMESLIQTPTGDTFNAELVDDTIQTFNKHLGNLGYAFVSIDPRYTRNTQEGTLDINYTVKEGPRVYIENINISGNVRTLDEVIRREFRIAEGDPYNAAKIKRSQQRINNLGFFGKVDISKEQGSASDKVDINVDVEEKSTGELTFGAGFSTNEGALGDISISERNLLGRGQFLKLNFTLASVRQEIDLSFTEPYFMDKEIAAGFDLFKLRRDGSSSRSNRTFDIDAIGGTLRSSYAVTEHLTHAIRYSLRRDEITDIDDDASEFIKRQEGTNTTSLVGHSLIYDKRDSRFDTRDGYYVRLNQDIAGLGGDAKFVRNEIRGGYWYPLYKKDWVLKLLGNGGVIFGFGSEDVRINDRFFIGGSEIRGFDSEGVGPRDDASKDPLGGNVYVTSSLELEFPLGLPEELGFRGAVFTDAGTLYETDDKSTATSTVLDESSIRAAAGVGVSWSSPLGPIRVDFAEAFAKESFDDTEVIRFSFGTRF